ncbi:MAG TPA: hypothetical protein ENJ95_11730 [Bacteroidetes bacterium]|nr:hypothetical protein [Bacteroidota bacterium]
MPVAVLWLGFMAAAKYSPLSAYSICDRRFLPVRKKDSNPIFFTFKQPMNMLNITPHTSVHYRGDGNTTLRKKSIIETFFPFIMIAVGIAGIYLMMNG